VSPKQENEKLTGPWGQIQGAIWLIGLAILFWQNWFWPGILVLVAISAIFEAVVRLWIKPRPPMSDTLDTVPPDIGGSIPQPAAAPAVKLPGRCPNCGAPVGADSVIWSADRQQAACPYCKTNLVT
jgi:DNA-directed RNA polymerase subunit RPC12/RpoP